MKKRFIGFLLLPLLMMGCNNSNNGHFGFCMGNPRSDHFGIDLYLKENAYPKDPQGRKEFKFVFDFNTMKSLQDTVLNDTSSSSTSSSIAPSSTSATSSSSTPAETSLEGSYSIGATEEEIKKGVPSNALKMNIFFQDGQEIPSEYMSYIIFATYSPEQVMLNIPVSMNDFAKRLQYIREDLSDLSRIYKIPDESSEYYYHSLPLPLGKVD